MQSIIDKYHFNVQIFRKEYLHILLWWVIGGLTAFFIVLALLPYLPDFLEKSRIAGSVNDVMLHIVKLLDSHVGLNIMVVIIFILGSANLIIKILQNKHLSIGNVVICSIASITLILPDICEDIHFRWVFPAFPYTKGFSYFYLYESLLILIILSELSKIKRYINIEKDYKHKAFTNETSEIPESYQVRGEYATEIARMLNLTDLKGESFAVAIEGRWGSGKSTFIRAMRPVIETRSYIIDFNPWNSSTAKDIVNDFFKLLSDKIAPLFSSLKKPLRNYSKILTNIDFNSTLNKFLNSFSEEEDINEIKATISNSLCYIEKPVTIFIDDLDRLGKNEIYEVLRLIRNTAKFPNILYVVTMDKDYVAKQLNNLGIDGYSYLEKIFPLEINLPKMDTTEVLLTLREELLKMTMNHKCVNGILDKFTQETKDKILYILPTFRSAKRYARQFASVFNFIHDSIGIGKINSVDLFVIELIHFYDHETYDIMANKMNQFFNFEIDESHNVLQYVFKKGVIESYRDSHGNIHQSKINDKTTRYFLRLIFVESEYNRNSIKLVENYLKYFGYNTPINRLTESEFLDFLSSTNSAKNRTVNMWCNGRKRPVLQQSIFNHFIAYPIEQITTEKELRNYLIGVFKWLQKENRETEENYYLLPLIMIKTRYRREIRNTAKILITNGIRNLTKTGYYLRNVKILSHALWHEDTPSPYITDNADILESIRLVISKLLNGHEYDNSLLVQEDGNIINKIAKFFIENKDNDIKGDGTTTTKILIEELGKNKKSQNKKQVEDRFKNVLKDNGDAYGEEEMLFNSIFGGKGLDLLKLYLDTCFV